VRSHLSQGGFSEAIVQYFGTSRDVLIRLAPRADVSSAEISTRVLEALQASAENKAEVRRIEFVGPQVGGELREDGGLAVLIALGAIFVYVMLRFEWRFSTGAVAATFHDVIITVGFFSVTGMEFDLTVLAAVLAVIGYSLNDTIVVYDRIRENFRKLRKAEPAEVINIATNQTLSRTVLTSLTTLLVVLSLLAFGGEIIRGFSTALAVGIVYGTYSSVYVASVLAMTLGVSRADLVKPVREGGVDDRP
jgi:preprotein translocase subunit SecF